MFIFIGIKPQIKFQYVTDNFVYKLTRRPFNLTAIVVSYLSLASLHWSPPAHSNPLPNKTLTVRHGNITTTTLMLLKNAILGDGGNYTLTAVNEFGRSSSKVEVEILTGKLVLYMHACIHSYICAYTHSYIHAYMH